MGILDDRHGLAEMKQLFAPELRREILTGAADPTWCSPEEYMRGLATETDSILRQATVTDFNVYLPDDILTKVDRASMLTSLEVRAPFLDRHVIEFAFGRVPDSLRATETDRKILLRMLGERLLPPELDLRRKQGFRIPLRTWLRGSYSTLVREIFESADPTFFRRPALLRMLNGENHESRIFAVLMFELWRREYGATL